MACAVMVSIGPLMQMATWSLPDTREKREREAAQPFFTHALAVVGHAPNGERLTVIPPAHEHMRVSEIATLLEKSEGAVRMTLTRTLNNLRGFYTKHQGEKR